MKVSRYRRANPSNCVIFWSHGYPYVLDQFRFRLTLTGSLAEANHAHWLELLKGFWTPVLGQRVPVGGVAVFRAPGLNMAFSQIGFFPFGD